MNRAVPAHIGRFVEWFNLLIKRTDFFGVGVKRMPTPNLVNCRKIIREGEKYLPVAYRAAYLRPFRKDLKRIWNKTIGNVDDVEGVAKGIAYMEILTGAIYDQLPWSRIASQVRQFQAVVADIYTSFLCSRRRKDIGLPLEERLPPLATFVGEPVQGYKKPPTPQTYTVDDMKGYSRKFKVGVVWLPLSFRNHPVLWSALAHEVGGHDVLHADSKLLPELTRKVRKLFDGDLGLLWQYWLDEAAADVCGVLNIGPSYGIGVTLYLAEFQARRATHRVMILNKMPHFKRKTSRFKHKMPRLQNRSDSEIVYFGKQDNEGKSILDEHPTHILVPYLIMGVIDELDGLKEQTRRRYAKMFAELAHLCAGDENTVEMHSGKGGRETYIYRDVLNGRDPTAIAKEWPLRMLQKSARKVGSYIASVKLDALQGYSIKDLETWDDQDEAVARNIADRFTKKKSVTGKGDDAHLLAGAVMAVVSDPSIYRKKSFNKSLEKALERSYREDPLIQKCPS